MINIRLTHNMKPANFVIMDRVAIVNNNHLCHHLA